MKSSEEEKPIAYEEKDRNVLQKVGDFFKGKGREEDEYD